MREKLAVAEKDWNSAALKFKSYDSIEEAAVLSTCNRFELYFTVSDFEQAERDVMQVLRDKSGMSDEELKPYLFFSRDGEAEIHLLRVACGIDSLVLGEAHILGQVKSCYRHAMAQESDEEPAGSAGKVLSKLLNTAISAGKYVRSELQIGVGGVSIPLAAVELGDIKAQSDLRSLYPYMNVAVVGAGEMSRVLLIHLEAKGVKRLKLFNRSPGSAQALADNHPDMQIDIHMMDEFMPLLEDIDMVFTSTSSPDLLITKEKLIAGGWGEEDRPLVTIDISMPSNVEFSCNELEGVHSYDIDDLKQVVDANTAKRRKIADEADEWLQGELARFEQWKNSLVFQELRSSISQKYDKIRAQAMAEASSLQDVSEDDREAVEKWTQELVTEYLGSPMQVLGTADFQSKVSVEQIERLFKVSA
jgi:glutamyl-tRNA reductase